MDPNARRPPVPRSWIEPPGPREAALRTRWDALDLAAKREIVRRSLTPGDAAGRDADLVAAVARREVARSGRSVLVAIGLGWLVLMTLWGFGRSGFPEAAGGFLAVGALSGVAVAAAGVRRARRRRARARAVVDLLTRTSASG